MNTVQLVQHLIIALQGQGMGPDDVLAWIEEARQGRTNLKLTPEQIEAAQAETELWKASIAP